MSTTTNNGYGNNNSNTNSHNLFSLASFLGASGVALGAMGAHKLQPFLVQRNMVEQWKTAVLYQLVHATAVLSMAALTESSSNKNDNKYLVRAGQFMAIGNLMFSGSIYLLCLGVGPRKVLGPTTPLGGMFMIAGWVMLAFHKKTDAPGLDNPKQL